MDNSLDDDAAAAHSQVPGWSSYSLSLPSQRPDIRNWFASYEYESPEIPELDAYCGGHNGSETQDPFEHLILPRDDGVAARENCLGAQSENELLDRKDSVSVDESIAKKPPKRKQSLRALFGFLDKHEEATESESQVALPVQRNTLEPLPICNATGLLDAKRSVEGTIKCSKMPVDCRGIGSLDTQVSSTPADEEVGYSKPPVTCGGSSLADNQKCFPIDDIDSIEHGMELADSEGISSVETHISSPVDEELEYSKLPVICDISRLVDIQKFLPEDSTDSIEYGKVPVDCDDISLADTQVSSPAVQKFESSKLPLTCDVAGLADIEKFFPDDGDDSFEKAINSFDTNATKTEGSQDSAEHRMLPGVILDTREYSAAEKIRRGKPALDNKGQEQTVSSDGFIAIKRKHRRPEECRTNNIQEYQRGTDEAPLQEGHNVLGRKVLAQVHTRSPLADRTNFPEAAAAPKIWSRRSTDISPQVHAACCGRPTHHAQCHLTPRRVQRPPHARHHRAFRKESNTYAAAADAPGYIYHFLPVLSPSSPTHTTHNTAHHWHIELYYFPPSIQRESTRTREFCRMQTAKVKMQDMASSAKAKMEEGTAKMHGKTGEATARTHGEKEMAKEEARAKKAQADANKHQEKAEHRANAATGHHGTTTRVPLTGHHATGTYPTSEKYI
ncbi:hypothetical protein EJB05_39519 [Eragrostis curvula]|uniref:Uncharacterized protein n=1 Tax=Eragrostis curvula TaxID=38414 RepID=A0A5J9TX73_9POAL|nr:hypothetical protein EJB05_39519 [Eragrostis curvula]